MGGNAICPAAGTIITWVIDKLGNLVRTANDSVIIKNQIDFVAVLDIKYDKVFTFDPL